MSSDFVKKLDKILEPIKNSPKFGGDYMSYQEAMYTERKMAWQEGRQEGREEGKTEERLEIIRQLKSAGVDESIIEQIRSRT